MSNSKDTKLPKFPGFDSPTYTPVPDALFDVLLTELAGGEMRVLLYIIRRTFGFKKGEDAISLSQMLNGITTQDGRVLDRGVGLSKKTLLAAINSLEEREIIITERRQSAEKGNEPTTYRLNVQLSSSEEKSTPPLGEKVHQGVGGKSTPSPWGKNSPTQETVVQETVKQEIYLSKIRKAKSEKNDYVNPSATAPNPYPVQHPTAGDDEDHPAKERKQGEQRAEDGKDMEIEEPSNYRNESKSQELKNLPPPREEKHNVPKGGATAAGFTSIGAMLPHQYLPQTIPDDEVREAIRDYIRDMGGKLHDDAPLEHSTTRAFNLYQRSGLDLSSFFNRLYDAEKEANRRSTTITKRSADGFPNRMAYFFAVLEDKLGLKPYQPAPAHTRGQEKP